MQTKEYVVFGHQDTEMGRILSDTDDGAVEEASKVFMPEITARIERAKCKTVVWKARAA